MLPRSKSWSSVVSEIELPEKTDEELEQLAKSTLSNVRTRFAKLHKDSGLNATVQYLIALSTFERTDSPPHLPYIDLGENPSPLRLVTALNAWVDNRQDLQEYATIAKRAAADTIGTWHSQGSSQPNLFTGTTTSRDVWRRAGTGSGFCELARIFFSKFTERYLNYFISREASASLTDLKQRDQLASGLNEHIDGVSKFAFEVSEITQSFAAGWFNKHASPNLPSSDDVETLIYVSLGKINEELSRESSPHVE